MCFHKEKNLLGSPWENNHFVTSFRQPHPSRNHPRPKLPRTPSRVTLGRSNPPSPAFSLSLSRPVSPRARRDQRLSASLRGILPIASWSESEGWRRPHAKKHHSQRRTSKASRSRSKVASSQVLSPVRRSKTTSSIVGSCCLYIKSVHFPKPFGLFWIAVL